MHATKTRQAIGNVQVASSSSEIYKNTPVVCAVPEVSPNSGRPSACCCPVALGRVFMELMAECGDKGLPDLAVKAEDLWVGDRGVASA